MCQTLKDRASLIFSPYAENIGELSVTLTTELAAKGCEIPNRRAAQSPVDFEALKLPVMKTLESALDGNVFLFGFILDINFNFWDGSTDGSHRLVNDFSIGLLFGPLRSSYVIDSAKSGFWQVLF